MRGLKGVGVDTDMPRDSQISIDPHLTIAANELTQPEPKKALILAVSNLPQHRIGSIITPLRKLMMQHNLNVHVLVEGDSRPIESALRGHFDGYPPIVVYGPEHSLAESRRSFLAGLQEGYDRVAFVSDINRVDAAILNSADCVFVTVRAHDVALVPARHGCTLITSVFRADRYLTGFLTNTRALIGYAHAIEHIFLISKMSSLEVDLIEDVIITDDNAVVLWHRSDPGLYECWNIGIRLSRTEYISNANVDDLRDPEHVVELVRDLEVHPDCVVAATALNPFYDYPHDGALPVDRPGWYADRPGRFTFHDLASLTSADPPGLTPFNMPHCMPVWRRRIHDQYGWFDERKFGTFADWAFWLKVLRSGSAGWLNERPLGFYFVNPTSHNRRGDDLNRYHQVVESEFLPDFLAKRGRGRRAARVDDVVDQQKLRLEGLDLSFGQHRNSFNRLLFSLAPLARRDGGGVKFVPFIERQFVWGDAPGEAGSSSPRPIMEPWIGILHVPFDAPDWYDASISPETIMKKELWLESRAACRGIITLAEDLASDIREFDKDLAVMALLHPTELDCTPFSVERYRARPRVVQVGDWLRKLQAIHRMKAPGHARIMLLKHGTQGYLDREMAVVGDLRDPNVDVRRLVPNEEYDELLASSVVVSLLYATAANNVVLECLARSTPILINPLPAVIEYLGFGYPLYVRDEGECDAALADSSRVEAAHHYLQQRRDEIDLTYEGFCRSLAQSEFYARL